MNSWSMLYDALMADAEWVEKMGGYEWTPSTSNVAIGTDVNPQFNLVGIDELMNNPSKNDYFKFNEDKVMEEVMDYIANTYRSHYNSGSGIQTLDLIESVGDAAAFCRSNILKYASRYDKKGAAKMDIKKIIHYAILLYHFTQKETKSDATGYETL